MPPSRCCVVSPSLVLVAISLLTSPVVSVVYFGNQPAAQRAQHPIPGSILAQPQLTPAVSRVPSVSGVPGMISLYPAGGAAASAQVQPSRVASPNAAQPVAQAPVYAQPQPAAQVVSAPVYAQPAQQVVQAPLYAQHQPLMQAPQPYMAPQQYVPPHAQYAPPYPPYQHHGYALDIDRPEYPHYGPPMHYVQPPPVYAQPVAPMVAMPQTIPQTIPIQTPTQNGTPAIRVGNAHTAVIQTVQPQAVQMSPVHMAPVHMSAIQMAPMPLPMPQPVGGYMSQRYVHDRFEGRACGPPSTPSPEFRVLQAEAFANTGRMPEHESTFECQCRMRRSCTSPDKVEPQHASYCGGMKIQRGVPLYNQYVCCCQHTGGTGMEMEG